MVSRDDTEFMRDLRAAVVRSPRISANILMISIIVFLIWGVAWANYAELDEVTVGMGKVIPSSKVKIVQNLEGGIVAKINVTEGQVIKKGDQLLIIDDTQFRSKFGEDYAKYLGYLAAGARLKSELQNQKNIEFPEKVVAEAPGLISAEMALKKARQRERETGLAVLRQQRVQKEQELIEADTQIKQLTKSLVLARKEKAYIAPMVKRGVMAEIELIRLDRGIVEIEGQLANTQQTKPRIKSAIQEVTQKIDEYQASYQSEIQAELADIEVNLAALNKILEAAEDRMVRTEVRSPVAGTIKKLNVNTIGGVIKPGMDLVEILPMDDSLLVEARIRPSDIAFLRPGLEAKVKITAYDYAVYGSLEAKLERISVDTIVDEEGESFYEIQVRTFKNYMGSESFPLPIIPGMVAEVDVLTGKKTVLEYLMKPLLRAQQKAMRER